MSPEPSAAPPPPDASDASGKEDADEAARQDLSAADEQELRAFVEKRKWFEAKLASLQALAPVYPFVHPVLVPCPDGEGFIRLGADGSACALPDRATVEAWTAERDALEEEVERFDGGDMERMKAKTRQVTRVPLTQPSTDLVEITLDLILVIDRLLGVLRHRGAVLDLAGLRLQWDALRWSIALETAKVRGEIDGIVRGRGRWAPPGADDAPATSTPGDGAGSGGPARRASAAFPFQTPTKRLAPLPGSASLGSLADAPPSPTDSAHSPTRAHFTPRRNLHLPILHSQVVGLQVRQRSLASSSLAASGAVIDRMIDAAGQLKGLGGVHGPEEDGGKEGAVPEELIDLQEELEEDVNEVAARLAWCKQLEEQWRKADAHHAASSRAREAAETVLQSLRVALASPPSADDHAHLAHGLRLATEALPPAIDDAFPRPSHPAYPDNDGHNDEVVAVLADARAAARQAIDVAQVGVAFHADLLAARRKVLDHGAQLRDVRVAIDDHAACLRGTDGAARPTLDAHGLGDACATWHARLPMWTSQAQATMRRAVDVHQRAAVDTMRYRKSMRAPPSVQPHLPDSGLDDPLIADTQADCEGLLAAIDQLKTGLAEATRDAEIHVLAHQIHANAGQVETNATRVRMELLAAMRDSAWPSRAARTVDVSRIDAVAATCEGTAATARQVQQLLVEQRRALPDLSACLEHLVTTSSERLAELRRLYHTCRQVGEQSAVAHAIDAESVQYITRARDLVSAIEGFSDVPDDVQARAAALRMDIDGWASSLASRALFVDTGTTTDFSAPINASALAAPRPSAPTLQGFAPQQVEPITPPVSPGHPPGTDTTDLAELDRRVRAHINARSSAVTSALAEVQRALDDVPVRAWAEQLAQTVGALDRNVQALVAEQTDKAGQLEAIDAHTAQEMPALEDLVLQLQQLQETLAGGGALGQDVRQAVVAVVDVLQASDAARQADRDAADRALSNANEALDAFGALVLAVAGAVKEAADRLARARAAAEDARQRATDDARAALERLRDRLEALNLPLIVSPSSEDLHQSPTLRRLPGAELARRARAELDSIAQVLAGLPTTEGTDAFEHDLQAAQGLAARLDELVAFASAARLCDAAFSRLLDAIDDASALSTDDAQAAVDALEIAFQLVRHDPRAVAERQRVLRAWDELRSLVDDTLHPGARVAAPSEAGSDVSALTTLTARTGPMRRAPSSISLASSARSASQPMGRTYDGSTEASRARAVSDVPKALGRAVAPGLPASRIPKAVRSSLPAANAPTPRSSLGASASRPPSRTSTAPATRARQPSLPSKSTPSRVPRPSFDTPRQRKAKAYVADPKSKLDVAVGRIVNRLDVSVPIVPVGLRSPDEWKDASGKYWIGAEGRARLCFCRILRSRTVMVRVGGGWVELSKFLMDHFADVVGSWQAPSDAAAPAAPVLAPTGTPGPFGYRSAPVPLTSTLLRQRQASRASSGAAGPGAPPPTPTPAHAPRASLGDQSTRSAATPPRATQPPTASTPGTLGTPGTPGSRGSRGSLGSPAGLGSPAALVPLHFIRRASESPSVRDKERAELRASASSASVSAAAAPRRSTLGHSVVGLGDVTEGAGAGDK